MNLIEDSVKIHDTTMDYIAFGQGNKPLVILPGLSLNRVKGAGLSLAYMYRRFAKEYRVYVFDKKEAVEQGVTIREMAADTAYVMEQLGIIKAYIFGVSQGGMIAQYIAMDYPRLVEKLVLAVTLSRQNESMKSAVDTWIHYAEKKELESFVEDMLVRLYSSKYIKKYRLLIPMMIRMSKKADLNRFVILAKSCFTCETYNELHKIQCPVLVLGGKQDQVVTGEASEEIAEKLNCKIFMYEELGHAAYEEAKDFNERIYTFLQSCD